MTLQLTYERGSRFMTLLSLACMVVTAVVPSGKAAAHTQAEPRTVFLLVKEDNGLLVRQEAVPQGQVRVFQSNPETGIIDVILPPGLGGSGSLEEISKGRLLVVSCRDQKVQVTTRLPDAKECVRPAQPIDVLSTYDIRVNVLGAQGLRLKGLISQYESFVHDEIVPFVDPFSGAVDPGPNEYIVYTETSKRRSFREDLQGVTPVEFFEGHHYVTANLPDGSAGQLIVDLGAGTTVVTRAVLPRYAQIREMQRTMHTPDGVKRLAAAIGGATGEFANILGSATVPLINLGGLRLTDVAAVVVEDLPEISGRRIVGILGIDILGRVERLSLEYPHPDRFGTSLRLNSPCAKAGSSLVLPFGLAGNIFVRGTINGRPVSFILDSGSPRSILDDTAAKSIGLPIGEASGYATGLGGERIQLRRATARSLQLAEQVFDNVEFDVGPLQVFAIYRGAQDIGLLGNSFLSRFACLEIDFGSHEVRLYK